MHPEPQTRICAAQVSPHEFMQAVMAASGKRFVIDRQADPVDFLSWFLNALHADLTGGKRKKPSVITRCFQVRRGFEMRYGSRRLGFLSGFLNVLHA